MVLGTLFSQSRDLFATPIPSSHVGTVVVSVEQTRMSAILDIANVAAMCYPVPLDVTPDAALVLVDILHSDILGRDE